MRRALKIVAALVLVTILALVAWAKTFLHDPSYRKLVHVGAEQDLVIEGARVFTATSTKVLEGHRVVISGGRITKIEPQGAPPPSSARVIDGRGKTLLPGLVDFHTHIANAPAPPWYVVLPSPEHNLEAYLYAGVTTIVSMGDDLGELAKIKAKLERGEIPGPRILYAGLPITKTGGHPQAAIDHIVPAPLRALLPSFSWQIETPADAEAAVEHMAKGGASLVKIVVDDLPPGVPKLSAEHIRAVVTAAHARNLKVAAHIGTAEDALLAATNGVDVLNHGVHRGTLDAAQARALAATGISVAPTLIVFERCAEVAAADMHFDALDRAIEPEEVLAQFSAEKLKAQRKPSFMRPYFEAVLASRGEKLANVKALRDAGIPILAGTDSSIIGNIAGASIHHELRMLVSAGLSPAEVLLAATARPAAFLYPEPQIGTIEVGRVADLLLVEGDPLADISVTQRIVAVIQAGRLVERHTDVTPAK